MFRQAKQKEQRQEEKKEERGRESEVARGRVLQSAELTIISLDPMASLKYAKQS